MQAGADRRPVCLTVKTKAAGHSRTAITAHSPQVSDSRKNSAQEGCSGRETVSDLDQATQMREFPQKGKQVL